MKLTILLISILLIGCSKSPEIECENITNTIETIKYINKTINNTIYINTTCTQYNYTGSTSRELELIRRIGYLEGQQNKYFNDSECNDNLNKTEIKLEDCEDEICKWNSSWC